MSDFTVVGLRVVREVASRGSFTAAADALGYTQSAISRQVAAMERAAGTPLFTRAARGVDTTPAGDALLRHAAGVLDHVDAAKRELTGLGDAARGSIKVGAFPTAIAALVPRAIATFATTHPAATVALREGMTPAQLRRVRARRAHLAVVSDAHAEGVVLEPLLDDPLLLAVSPGHRLARRRRVDPDDLRDERWITGSTDPDDTILGTLHATPQVGFLARDWTAKLGLVAAGLGVALVPGLAAHAVRPDIALVEVRGARRQVAIATHPGDDGALARAFADTLHDVAAQLTAELRERLA